MKSKLVRDKIIDIIKSSGRTPISHIANKEEYYSKLKEKIVEEVDEFLDEDNAEELADILEVIYAIRDAKNISKEELETIRKQKNNKRGSFKDKIILDNIK